MGWSNTEYELAEIADALEIEKEKQTKTDWCKGSTSDFDSDSSSSNLLSVAINLIKGVRNCKEVMKRKEKIRLSRAKKTNRLLN